MLRLGWLLAFPLLETVRRREQTTPSASCPIYCIEHRAILPSLPPPSTVSITHFASVLYTARIAVILPAPVNEPAFYWK